MSETLNGYDDWKTTPPDDEDTYTPAMNAVYDELYDDVAGTVAVLRGLQKRYKNAMAARGFAGELNEHISVAITSLREGWDV